jgi:hypothetical protein
MRRGGLLGTTQCRCGGRRLKSAADARASPPHPRGPSDKKARKSYFSTLFQFHNLRTSVLRYCRFLPMAPVAESWQLQRAGLKSQPRYQQHWFFPFRMSRLRLLLLALFIAAAGIDIAAAAPLQHVNGASRASETSTRTAAALVLPELSHISPPSDPRICLTNILMTYFRFALRLRSPTTRRLMHSQRI